jgi:CTD small phosphatase-like protein 2
MVIFTAAEKEYADLIIDQIDPENKFFRHRLYRDHCFKSDDAYVKDLRIISDRELEDIVIVDNSIISFAK